MLIRENLPRFYQKSSACKCVIRAIRSRLTLAKNVVIVGGGIAGLAASVYLARGGRTVTLFEKRRYLGGRAVTHLRHGYRFNLGPHAFYRGGEGSKVLGELGIAVRGGIARGAGIALYGQERHTFPRNFFSLLTTGLLKAGEKLEASKLLWRIRRLKKSPQLAEISASEWLDANVTRARVRETLAAVIPLAAFRGELEKLEGGAALNQVRLAMRGVIYIDEGWQKLVHPLPSSPVTPIPNLLPSPPAI